MFGGRVARGVHVARAGQIYFKIRLQCVRTITGSPGLQCVRTITGSPGLQCVRTITGSPGLQCVRTITGSITGSPGRRPVLRPDGSRKRRRLRFVFYPGTTAEFVFCPGYYCSSATRLNDTVRALSAGASTLALDTSTTTVSPTLSTSVTVTAAAPLGVWANAADRSTLRPVGSRSLRATARAPERPTNPRPETVWSYIKWEFHCVILDSRRVLLLGTPSTDRCWEQNTSQIQIVAPFSKGGAML